MKKLLLASTVLAGLTATATAADLPRRMAPPPVYNPIPVFTWTGFYLGFNAGYGFGTSDDKGATFVNGNQASGLFLDRTSGAPVDGLVAFKNGSSTDGFVGGGQVGYNYQFTPGSGIVVGVEADAQYVDFGRNRTAFSGPLSSSTANAVVNPGVTLVNPNGLSGLDYFGTVRGRLGYAFDRTLVYGTGGFAYGSGGDSSFSGVKSDEFRTGWAAGGGVEYALPTDSFLNFFKSSAVTFKVEGLYVNLDRNRSSDGVFAISNPGGAIVGTVGNQNVVSNFAAKRSDEFAVVRAGVNYKFGSY